MSELDLNFRPLMPERMGVPIGCIGSGFIMADCHLVAYRKAGFNPVAIASQSFENARRVAARHQLTAYPDFETMLDHASIEVVDVAVPPDAQWNVIDAVCQRRGKIRGILAQKPLGVNYQEACRIVARCREAGITLCVNQNMRYDQSIRALKSLLNSGRLGEPVFATIDMRAIPHWMPWQKRQGWVTLRVMSIHHLDAFRFLFGDPERVFASVRTDPRTEAKFAHEDGICLYILEYANGFRATAWDDVWSGPALEGAARDIGIRWRVEGRNGMARGTIGWPDYPTPQPSTLDYTTIDSPSWFQPRWTEAWFPDAFAGPMAELLCSIEKGTPANLSGDDNLKTMALVDACYLSAKEHRAVEIREVASVTS